MTMKQKYVKWRRGRTIDRAIANGKRLNELREARAGINGSIWPSVARELDLAIEAKERKAQDFRAYLMKTEAL